MPKKEIKPKLKPITEQINNELAKLPPPEISVFADIITRKKTPHELEQEEKSNQLFRRFLGLE